MTPSQQEVLDNLTCDLEYNTSKEQLQEVINNWTQFQSQLLLKIKEVEEEMDPEEDVESDDAA